MSEWAELWDGWRGLGQELEQKMGNLGLRERGVVQGFYQEIEQTLLKPLQDLEQAIERGSPNPPQFSDVFKRILSVFHGLATRGPLVGAELGVDLLNMVWSKGIEAITSFLERKAGAVQVESWTIGVTGGFPVGVSATVEVTFSSRRAS